MREGLGGAQQAARSGEAKSSDPAKSPLFGATTAPAGMDHQVPRPNFGQILAKCDLEGKEPIFATPDRSLEHDEYTQSSDSSPAGVKQTVGEK